MPDPIGLYFQPKVETVANHCCYHLGIIGLRPRISYHLQQVELLVGFAHTAPRLSNPLADTFPRGFGLRPLPLGGYVVTRAIQMVWAPPIMPWLLYVISCAFQRPFGLRLIVPWISLITCAIIQTVWAPPIVPWWS